MSDSKISVDQFRTVTLERFSFLEDKGFSRKPELEVTSPMGGSVVYMGKYVGFTLSLDVRDQCVDAQVFKVVDGKMKRNWEGGYSSEITSHLIKYTGYRGGMGKQPQETGALERMVISWVELLKVHGQTLLADQPDSLAKK